MTKILSDNQVDALLSNVANGGDSPAVKGKLKSAPGPTKDAVVYDFKHPNRVSKDQMRTLESLHSNFAGLFGSALSGITRSVVDRSLLSVNQITYSEFITSLASPSCTYVFSVMPIDGAGIMDFNPGLVFTFVDRMFGGVGKTLETERELTGVEKSIMAKIVTRSLRELEKAWGHILSLQFKQSSFESNPHFIQIVSPGETVIVISLQVKIMSLTRTMTICYPYLTLETVVGKLSAQNWIDKNKKIVVKSDRALNIRRIEPVTATVKAILGKTSLNIRELIGIKVGDVVKLDQRTYDEIGIFVGDKLKFRAKPGLCGNQMALKITDYH